MKNIAVFILIFFLLSCGNDNKSAINDLGDTSSYVEHREKERKGKKSDFNLNSSSSSNNEINESVENVSSEGGASMDFKYSLGFR